MSIQLKEASLSGCGALRPSVHPGQMGSLAALLEFMLFCSLIAESGVKRRSNGYPTSAGPSAILNVRGYRFVILLTQLQSRVPSRTPAIFHTNTSNFSLDHASFSRYTTETKLLLTLNFSMVYIQELLIYIYVHMHKGLT